jgi:hypothetical protein
MAEVDAQRPNVEGDTNDPQAVATAEMLDNTVQANYVASFSDRAQASLRIRRYASEPPASDLALC